MMTDRLNPEALTNLRLLADEGTRELRHVVLEPDLLNKLLDVAETALLAPRTITTIAELDALPFETIVLDAEDDHMKRVSNGEGGAYWERFGDTWTYPPEDVCLPARVLWVPTEGGGE